MFQAMTKGKGPPPDAKGTLSALWQKKSQPRLAEGSTPGGDGPSMKPDQQPVAAGEDAAGAQGAQEQPQQPAGGAAAAGHEVVIVDSDEEAEAPAQEVCSWG